MLIVHLTAAGTTAETAAIFSPAKSGLPMITDGETLVLARADTFVPDEVGGIAIPNINTGDVIKILAVDRLAPSIRVYMPDGHSYYVGNGKTDSRDPFKVSKGGVPLTLTKTDATEWAVW